MPATTSSKQLGLGAAPLLSCRATHRLGAAATAMMQGEHRLGVQDVELMPKQRISASNTEAYGWQRAPRYIIRDRDRVYGRAVLSRLRAMGIRIGRLQCGRHGRTDVLNGSLDPSGGTALTMSLCLASGTFVICSTHIKNTTTRRAPICPWRRTRRSRARICSKRIQKNNTTRLARIYRWRGRANPARDPGHRSYLGRTSLGRAPPPICSNVSVQQGHRISAWRRAVSRNLKI